MLAPAVAFPGMRVTEEMGRRGASLWHPMPTSLSLPFAGERKGLLLLDLEGLVSLSSDLDQHLVTTRGRELHHR